MTLRWTLLRVTPLGVSLLLHVVACGAITMVPKFVAVREHVLIADLVEPDPTPPPPPATPPPPTPRAVAPPRPKAPDPRPLTLPKPLDTPMPVMKPPPVETVETPPPPPPPPPPVVQEPPAPVVSVTPHASAPLEAPPATGGDELPVASHVEPPAGPFVSGPAPAAPSASKPPSSAPSVSGLASATPSAPAAPASAAGATGPAVASRPTDGLTQTAAPRGGYQVRPSYPHSARRLGIQGTTLLSVFVAADGRVGDVVVKSSAGHPDLDRAAADAVRRWRFEPARRGSEAVAMWVLLPVEFRLR